MSGLDLDLLANAGYVVILVSLMMRDILWLRVFSVLAACLLIPYVLLQPQPLWPAVAWNLTFTTVNVYWIIRLLVERRPVRFSSDEQRLYDAALRTLRPRDARKIFKAGVWRSVDAGQHIATQGKPLNELSLIASGAATIKRNGEPVDEIGEGRFIGCINFLRCGRDLPTPVTFKVASPARLVVWDYDQLRKLISNDTELSLAVEARLGLELASHLDHARRDLERARASYQSMEHLASAV